MGYPVRSLRLDEAAERAAADARAGGIHSVRDALVPGGFLEIDGVRWDVQMVIDASNWLTVSATSYPLERVWFAGQVKRSESVDDLARELLDECRAQIAEAHAEVSRLAAVIAASSR